MAKDIIKNNYVVRGTFSLCETNSRNPREKSNGTDLSRKEFFPLSINISVERMDM
jgi:hypothetical protein